jgi:uncharacterized DUF497 family protein
MKLREAMLPFVHHFSVPCDWVEAKALWNDTNAIGFPARSDDEERFALLTKSAGKHWVAFYTLRKDKIRLISVRRARKGEKEVYES